MGEFARWTRVIFCRKYDMINVTWITGSSGKEKT